MAKKTKKGGPGAKAGRARAGKLETERRTNEIALAIAGGHTGIVTLEKSKAEVWKVSRRRVRNIIRVAEKQLKDQGLYQREHDFQLALANIERTIRETWDQIEVARQGSEVEQTVVNVIPGGKKTSPKLVPVRIIRTKNKTQAREIAALLSVLVKAQDQRNKLLGLYRPERKTDDEEPDVIEVDFTEMAPVDSVKSKALPDDGSSQDIKA